MPGDELPGKLTVVQLSSTLLRVKDVGIEILLINMYRFCFLILPVE